jgi:hypothetical protein
MHESSHHGSANQIADDAIPSIRPQSPAPGVQALAHGPGQRNRGDSRTNHYAGDRRDRALCQGGQLRLLQPLRGEQALTNGKLKGRGNTKNGNKYLAWAYIEAANFAVRYSPEIRRYYQRKAARTNGIVAIKTVAHKLARACYYILRDQVAFDVDRAFS